MKKKLNIQNKKINNVIQTTCKCVISIKIITEAKHKTLQKKKKNMFVFGANSLHEMLRDRQIYRQMER